MIYFLDTLVLILGAALVITITIRCNHYYGVPHEREGKIFQVCYKCGKAREVNDRF